MRVMSAENSRGLLIRNVKGMFIQVPPEIFRCQSSLGPIPTLVWINMVALAQKQKPLKIQDLAETMGLEQREVSQALALLADRGWINDGGLEIQMVLPDTQSIEFSPPNDSVLDEEQASFEWLVSYSAARIGPPSPDEMRKLLHWMVKKGLSHEVIAVAIEEMTVQVENPGFPYLEGILRNWHATGIRSYNDLLENPHLTKVLGPIAANRQPSMAEQRWKEVFPDEFD